MYGLDKESYEKLLKEVLVLSNQTIDYLLGRYLVFEVYDKNQNLKSKKSSFISD